MIYKIYLLRDKMPGVYWPGSNYCESKEEAQEAFDDLSDVSRYLRLHVSTDDGVIYPLVLMEFDDPFQELQDANEIDRFEPGIIFDDEAFDWSDVECARDVPMVESGRREWYLFADSVDAGEKAAERWMDMAKYDSKEFVCMIGEERLVQWALGEPDSFGISSLEDFCDTAAQHPEEEWASYDGVEIDVQGVSQEVIDDLGFYPTVAYRHN